jgi:hypothetical protein
MEDAVSLAIEQIIRLGMGERPKSQVKEKVPEKDYDLFTMDEGFFAAVPNTAEAFRLLKKKFPNQLKKDKGREYFRISNLDTKKLLELKAMPFDMMRTLFEKFPV